MRQGLWLEWAVRVAWLDHGSRSVGRGRAPSRGMHLVSVRGNGPNPARANRARLYSVPMTDAVRILHTDGSGWDSGHSFGEIGMPRNAIRFHILRIPGVFRPRNGAIHACLVSCPAAGKEEKSLSRRREAREGRGISALESSFYQEQEEVIGRSAQTIPAQAAIMCKDGGFFFSILWVVDGANVERTA